MKKTLLVLAVLLMLNPVVSSKVFADSRGSLTVSATFGPPPGRSMFRSCTIILPLRSSWSMSPVMRKRIVTASAITIATIMNAVPGTTAIVDGTWNLPSFTTIPNIASPEATDTSHQRAIPSPFPGTKKSQREKCWLFFVPQFCD